MIFMHVPPHSERIAMIKLLSLGFGSLAGLATLSTLAMVDATVAVAGPVQSADHVSYVLFASNSDSISMSGSTDDIRRARALRNGHEAMLYFRQGSAAYVIRDPATLRQAKAIFKPQEDLGTRQGELGRRQGELGKKQGELGAEQGRLGTLQANSPPRQATELGRQQGELGRRQGELGAQQGELGRQQGELGREQARLGSIAQEKIKVLLADAIRRGLAHRVN
jgi:bla regulator protein blaR1